MESCWYPTLSEERRKNVERSQEYLDDVMCLLEIPSTTIDKILSTEDFRAMLPRTAEGYEQFKKAVQKVNKPEFLSLGKLYLRNEVEIVVADTSSNQPSSVSSSAPVVDVVDISEEEDKDDKAPDLALYMKLLNYCIKSPEMMSIANTINSIDDITEDIRIKIITEFNNIFTIMIQNKLLGCAEENIMKIYIDTHAVKVFKDIKKEHEKNLAELFETDYNAYIDKCIATADKADLDKLVSLYDTNKDLDQIAEVGTAIVYTAMAKFKASNNDIKKSLQKKLAEDLESIIDSVVKKYKSKNKPQTNYDYDQITEILKNFDPNTPVADILKKIQADQSKQPKDDGNKISLKYLTDCGFTAPDNNAQNKINEINELIKRFSKIGNFIRAAVKEKKLPYIESKVTEDLYNIGFLDTDYKEIADRYIVIDNKCIFGNDLYILVNHPKNGNANFYPYDMVPFTVSESNFSKCINGINEDEANIALKDLPINYSEILLRLARCPFKNTKVTGIDLVDKNQYRKVLEDVDLLSYNIDAYGINDNIIIHNPHIHFISINKSNKKEYTIEVEYVDSNSNQLLKVTFDLIKKCFSTEMSTGEKETNLPIIAKNELADKSKLKNKYSSSK